MSTSRPVTEFDLRDPEFKHPDIKPEDYEFREDGRLVRKDRWEQAVRSIACALGVAREFECDLLVFSVEKLIERARAEGHEDLYFDEYPQ